MYLHYSTKTSMSYTHTIYYIVLKCHNCSVTFGDEAQRSHEAQGPITIFECVKKKKKRKWRIPMNHKLQATNN